MGAFLRVESGPGHARGSGQGCSAAWNPRSTRVEQRSDGRRRIAAFDQLGGIFAQRARQYVQLYVCGVGGREHDPQPPTDLQIARTGGDSPVIRFRQAVRDTGEATELLMKLRPVTFRYREEVAKRRSGLARAQP